MFSNAYTICALALGFYCQLPISSHVLDLPRSFLYLPNVFLFHPGRCVISLIISAVH